MIAKILAATGIRDAFRAWRRKAATQAKVEAREIIARMRAA